MSGGNSCRLAFPSVLLSALRRDSHLNTLAAQSFNKRLRSASIRHDDIDVIQTAKGQYRLTPKLRMIEAKDHLLRGPNHGSLNIDQQPMRIGNSFQRNAPSTHDR